MTQEAFGGLCALDLSPWYVCIKLSNAVADFDTDQVHLN